MKETPPGAPFPPREGELLYHRHFRSKVLDNERDLIVYVPPGYRKERTRRYPVIFFHDGQNVFDPSTATYGNAWLADLIAERLIRAGRIPPLIMVGIPHTKERHEEYTTHFDKKQKEGGRGALYGRFLFEEVKPMIDKEYRTLTDRNFVAVIGSSLGGLITLALAQTYHDHFALCGAMSPALWWSRGQILKDLEHHADWMSRMRIWMDMGTREGSTRRVMHAGIHRARQLVQRFDQAELNPGRDYYYWEIAGGEHTEASWSARLDKVLLYLFGDFASAAHH